MNAKSQGGWLFFSWLGLHLVPFIPGTPRGYMLTKKLDKLTQDF